jgi:hypothetical protein
MSTAFSVNSFSPSEVADAIILAFVCSCYISITTTNSKNVAKDSTIMSLGTYMETVTGRLFPNTIQLWLSTSVKKLG